MNCLLIITWKQFANVTKIQCFLRQSLNKKKRCGIVGAQNVPISNSVGISTVVLPVDQAVVRIHVRKFGQVSDLDVGPHPASQWGHSWSTLRYGAIWKRKNLCQISGNSDLHFRLLRHDNIWYAIFIIVVAVICSLERSNVEKNSINYLADLFPTFLRGNFILG